MTWRRGRPWLALQWLRGKACSSIQVPEPYPARQGDGAPCRWTGARFTLDHQEGHTGSRSNTENRLKWMIAVYNDIWTMWHSVPWWTSPTFSNCVNLDSIKSEAGGDGQHGPLDRILRRTYRRVIRATTCRAEYRQTKLPEWIPEWIPEWRGSCAATILWVSPNRNPAPEAWRGWRCWWQTKS